MASDKNSGTLLISLNAGDDVPDDKLLDLTYQVQKQLKAQGIDDVRRPDTQTLPQGAKSGGRFDINLINTLIIPLFASGGLITSIISVLQEWALRKEGRTVKIKAQKGDHNFEFEYNPAVMTHDELIDLAKQLTQVMDNRDDVHGD